MAPAGQISDRELMEPPELFSTKMFVFSNWRRVLNSAPSIFPPGRPVKNRRILGCLGCGNGLQTARRRIAILLAALLSVRRQSNKQRGSSALIQQIVIMLSNLTAGEYFARFGNLPNSPISRDSLVDGLNPSKICANLIGYSA